MLLYFTRSEKCGIDDKILNSLLSQLPSVCKQLFLIERAMSILMVDDKPSIHLVLPMTRKLKYLPENNMKNLNKTEEYVAKLIAKNYYEELEKGCLKKDDKMKDIYAISFSLFPYAYCFSKDRELVDECNEIAAREFVQRARLDGIHDDERMKELFMSIVSQCHYDCEDYTGSVYSNLLSFECQLQGSVQTVNSITQVKDLSRKDLLKERQQKLKTQLKYYQKRLEGVQNQLPSQERQRKRGRTQCDKGYYEAKILEF